MNLISDAWVGIIQALLLLLVANGAPLIVRKIVGEHWGYPVDMGLTWFDHQRLLGGSKTWRGLLASMVATGCMASGMGLGISTGMLFGALSMGGDLLASFLKRRRGHAESSRARGLDTVPESLLPLWALNDRLPLDVIGIALVMGIFFLIEEFVSPLLYKWHIRNQPY